MITILYVADPLASAAFYDKVFGAPALEASPGFALLKMPGDFMLGLWRRADVLPEAAAQTLGGELAHQVETDAGVDATLADWRAKGVRIAQQPTKMDFGYTFAGLDPDGHRLRVFSPT